MSDDKAKAFGCLAVLLAATALPAAVAISVIRDMLRRLVPMTFPGGNALFDHIRAFTSCRSAVREILRRLIHWDQTGEWR